MRCSLDNANKSSRQLHLRAARLEHSRLLPTHRALQALFLSPSQPIVSQIVHGEGSMVAGLHACICSNSSQCGLGQDGSVAWGCHCLLARHAHAAKCARVSNCRCTEASDARAEAEFLSRFSVLVSRSFSLSEPRVASLLPRLLMPSAGAESQINSAGFLDPIPNQHQHSPSRLWTPNHGWGL